MEEPDERSEFSHKFGGIQSNSSSPQNFLPANDPLISGNNAEQTWKKTSKRRGKRALEIKREVNGAFLPERNIALPLKNVIQGSKTVAAAVVAALEDANISSEFSPQPQSPIVQAQDDSTSNPRDEEESDLALGNVSKRPRLLVSGDDTKDIGHDKPSKSLLSTPHIWILSDRSKAISTMTSEMK
ncbi:hypothetical protein KIN20_002233 [Parelaphostrongylus tenuis]|uniref:Uncharacterized protein n=1 Tax=Parelaphostrongylus tenuis TaxID=148309 RepID=A0AAD5MGA3_PARTN|nr:hypothetical protein KIN20_002233 [Parelaphostrongylus tenuis]